MIADLGFLITSLSGRTESVSARRHKSPPRAVITSHKRRHRPRTQVVTDTPCPCQCWKKADYVYQGFDAPTKSLWRSGVKKPHMSGYDLWMKSTVHNFARKTNAPEVPPVSGGFSQAGNVPGDTWHVPPLDSKPWQPEDDPDFGGPYPLGIPCDWCLYGGIMPLYRQVHVTGLVGIAKPFNGFYYLTQTDYPTHCRSQAIYNGLYVTAYPDGPTGFGVTLNIYPPPHPGSLLWLTKFWPNHDCLELITTPWYSGGGIFQAQTSASADVMPAVHGK